MKLSKLISNIDRYEELQAFCKGQILVCFFDKYFISLKYSGKFYEVRLKNGKTIQIGRFYEPSGMKSAFCDRPRLIEFGFIDDLSEWKKKKDCYFGIKKQTSLIKEQMETKLIEPLIAKTLRCSNPKCDFEMQIAEEKEAFHSYKCYLCGSEMYRLSEETSLKESDAVNHPSHYTQGKVECIDAIESATINKKGVEAICVANIIKYLWRYESKNGLEDVKKARWYIQKLIEKLEKLEKK